MSAPLYLLAGGHGQARKGADPILQKVFAQTGCAAPSIAYVGAASDDDAGFLKWLAALFRNSGSGPVKLAPMAGGHADLDEARRVLETSDLIYITGGDVEAGMALLHRLRMDALLHRLYRAGRPFFGLSAGSIMLARAWVRWSDPDDDATAEPFPCLGFARVLCDCHAEADDWEELHALLRLQPGLTVGYGIPSGAALKVAEDGSVQALGRPVCRFEHRHGRTALRGMVEVAG
jgi:peptidase E